MSSDIEELAREGMQQFAAGMRVSPDLAARTCLGHRRRIRRKLTGLAGAAVVTGGAALAVTTLISRTHQPGDQPRANLTAWTVSKLADGSISITVNQFKDPAGLQSRLRADGVPASVTFTDQRNPACRPYPGGTLGPPSDPVTPLLTQVFPKPYQALSQALAHLPPPHPGWDSGTGRPPGPPSANSVVVVIDPSAIPSHSGVQLAANHTASLPTLILVPQVVRASTRCTGS